MNQKLALLGAAAVVGLALTGCATEQPPAAATPAPAAVAPLERNTDRTDLTREQCMTLLAAGSIGCKVGAGPVIDTYLIAAASVAECATTTSPDPTPETGRSLCVVIGGPDQGQTVPITTTGA